MVRVVAVTLIMCALRRFVAAYVDRSAVRR